MNECSNIIVESLFDMNELFISYFTKLVLPTPESPKITTLKANSGFISGFNSFISSLSIIFLFLIIIILYFFDKII